MLGSARHCLRWRLRSSRTSGSSRAQHCRKASYPESLACFVGCVYMSNSDVAEYRRRTDEAIRRLSGETDPAAWDHCRKLAIEYSRLSDLAAMREGLSGSEPSTRVAKRLKARTTVYVGYRYGRDCGRGEFSGVSMVACTRVALVTWSPLGGANQVKAKIAIKATPTRIHENASEALSSGAGRRRQLL